ncbi:MAG: AAA family ATPase [Proteobacteria bacterium]|nr:AAA family ATPase [Pseudomonadota bacterium]
MITVDRLVIKEFRGIRDLDLTFSGRNFGVGGPNGTGKSGIVDALEFVLTGTISRLSGRGRGDLSIKEHAPHVDTSKSPEKAIVEAYVTIPTLQAKVHLVRSVKNPRALKATPDTPAIRRALAHVESHPEIALSRREIIRYILTEPGQRSKDVQELLRLDALETLRTNLQRIANSCDADVRRAEGTRTSATGELTKALNIPQATATALLAAVNAQRAVLGLPAFEVLAPNTSLRDGLATTGGTAASPVPKALAAANLDELDTAVGGFVSADASAGRAAAAVALGDLKEDEALLDGVKRGQLLSLALELFDNEHCSVCDTPWEPEAYRAVIAAKQASLVAISAKRRDAEKLLEPIIDEHRLVARLINVVASYGPLLTPKVQVEALRSHAGFLEARANRLEQFMPLDAAIEDLRAPSALPANVADALAAVSKGIAGIPEPTQQQQAWDMLTIGQEKLETYRASRLALDRATLRAASARKVFDVYIASTKTALEGIYAKVEAAFTEYYRLLNEDDESTFAAKLTPSMGKLGFGVDFYQRGYFPPGAYHSEGHQDSMGLCLYLALMQHLQGAGFTFAVLDDVLMSVDAGHRRQVCKLLKTKFPNTQFVLTTHDKVWLKHMNTAGLVGSKAIVHFRKWDVDHGPSPWATDDIWAEIEAYVSNNEIQAAAALLRHYLEHLAAEICQALRAPVEYRADGQYDLGDLLPPAVSEFRKQLKRAKSAAQSWGHKDVFEKVDAFEKDYGTALAAADVEQWLINPAVHFNQWANFTKQDFAPVVAGYKALIGKFRCGTCSDLIEVRPPRGKHEGLFCTCGANSLSLQEKPSSAASAAGN